MTFSFHRGLTGMLLLASACDAAKGDGGETGVECPVDRIVAGGTAYESLQEATVSGAGGKVAVCAGVFSGGDFIGATSDLQVEGVSAEETRFDGEGRDGSVLTASVTGSLTLSGVTLTGGLTRMDADENGGSPGGLGLSTTRATLSDMEISDNVADWGGGLFVLSATLDGSRPEVTVSNSRIVRNAAYWGGGALSLTGPSTVTLVNVDLGVEAEDNSPDDIAFFDGLPTLDSHEPVAVFQFDGVVSVTCVWETRTCE